MTLETRITKLEKADPARNRFPEIGFVEFIEHDLTATPEIAVIVGRPHLRVTRHDHETAEDFYRRAYAVKSGGTQVEDMTGKEHAAALAAADERLAQRMSSK